MSDKAKTEGSASGGGTVNSGQSLLGDIRSSMKNAYEKGLKVAGEAQAFQRGNAEALAEASRHTAQGIAEIGQDTGEYLAKSLERARDVFQQLLTVKTPAEFVKVHGDYMKSSLEAAASHNAKVTEVLARVATDSAKPLSGRLSAAAETIKRDSGH